MYANIAQINYLKKGIGVTMKRLLEAVGSVEDNYYGINSPQLNTLLDVGLSHRGL
jgi:hypothetical protein